MEKREIFSLLLKINKKLTPIKDFQSIETRVFISNLIAKMFNNYEHLTIKEIRDAFYNELNEDSLFYLRSNAENYDFFEEWSKLTELLG